MFVLDPEAGEIRFGDGLRGARPPRGAALRADYDTACGRAGNVGAEGDQHRARAARRASRSSNPVRTWGGADAETVAEGEKQIARYLQHRDRLVTAADFETIAWRTPGVDIGRVDVAAGLQPRARRSTSRATRPAR